MAKQYILLDVGGTEIKGGIADEDGNIRRKIRSFHACADQDMQTIFVNFALILRELMDQDPGEETAGVGFAFPGPFDYHAGVSLMRGLSKYDSIYGIPVEPEIKSILPALADVPFTFLHDVEAFALGESFYGAARGYGRVFCICIGTGAGSAFIENGRTVKEQRGEVPENGWIYSVPYREGVIDDYLSVRGLARISRRILGYPENGRRLSEMARAGSSEAADVWRLFGRDVRDALLPFLDGFRPDMAVIGGQIAKSFDLFGGDFRQECEKRKIQTVTEPETSVRAMQGLLAVMTGK